MIKKKINFLSIVFLLSFFLPTTSFSVESFEDDARNKRLGLEHKERDSAHITRERFLRDISLANFNPDLINLRHKISSILSVCEKLFLNCIDTSNILKADDFFFADNHLNENGSQNLIKYLSSNFR